LIFTPFFSVAKPQKSILKLTGGDCAVEKLTKPNAFLEIGNPAFSQILNK